MTEQLDVQLAEQVDKTLANENLIFPAVQKKNERVVGLVINSIKEALLNGLLKAGDCLPSVTVLSESMNVSVASVREALKVLEGVGVIESRQGKGTYVCTDLRQDAINVMTFQLLVLPRTAQELIEFRMMFETAYTVMAMEKATEEDLKNLEKIVTKLEEKVQTDPIIEVKDEMEFHMGVLLCTHNPYVIHVGQMVLELFMTTIRKDPQPSEKYFVPADHRRIYESMKAKDREKLVEELNINFCGWKEKYFS